MSDAITPLHVWSGHSPLRGPVALPRLLEAAAEMGHARIALTDVNGLYGATAFHRLALQAGLTPILGAELRASGGPAAVALVASDEGYANLCGLITKVQRDARNTSSLLKASAATRRDSVESRKAPTRGASSAANHYTVPDSEFRVPGSGLPVPGSGFPSLTVAIAAHQVGLRWIVEDAALAAKLLTAGVEPRRLYLGIDPVAQEAAVRHRLLRAGEELGLVLVATGKAMFLDQGDYDVARVLAAARCGTTVDAVEAAELPHAGATLRSPRQLARQYAELPAAAAENRRLAEECSSWRLLPRRAAFPRFDCRPGDCAADMLRRLCREGIARRYGASSERIERRLARELEIIERKGFADYFLVVWDIVQYARRRRAPVAGRGSGASSLVAYLLGITNVCPLALDIPFERFLHERREDWPDLDVDFCWRIRDEVIDYALGRWGRDRTAMVSMHCLFQEASAFREAAKAFGLSDEQISENRDAPHFSPPQASSPSHVPSGKMGRVPIFAADPRLPAAAAVARRMVGLLHNLSVHPGGIVIAPGPMTAVAPVEPAPKGVNITQYDKDGAEAVGLVKLDLLGNRSLSTIRAACELVRRHEGVAVDVEGLPDGDQAAVALLRSADTVGCNQIESPAMRHLLRAMQPAGVRGLMKALALVRPGAASIGMKEVFLRRLRGLEEVPAGFPPVDALLAETKGVMLYEDDVMLAAAAMLGTGLGEADRFRKAVQKCRTDGERLGLSREFLARCRANGVPEDFARSTWVQMAKFNNYSFCRAHAASYATLAYASAYLRAHWPAEFWAAALNNNQSMYPPRVYVEQAKRMGVRFALPDANRSEEGFSIDDFRLSIEDGVSSERIHPHNPFNPHNPFPLPPDNQRSSNGSQDPLPSPNPQSAIRDPQFFIRVGLGCIAGLGPAGVEAVLKARGIGGPFASLTDFLARSGLGRQEARAMIQCGAFDFTRRSRPALMMELNLFLSLRPHRRDDGGRLLPARPTIPDCIDDYPPRRKRAEEWRILGLSVGDHPLAAYRAALAGLVDADSRLLPARVGRRVRIAGVLEAQRTAQTADGQTMLFATLDDEHGLFEAVCFPAVFAATGPLARYGPWLVTGKVEEQFGTITIAAEAIECPRLKAA